MAMTLKQTKQDVVFDVFNYGILTIFLLLVLYPLYFIVIASFSDPHAIYTGDVWLFPRDASLEGYQRIFEDSGIWRGYWNSFRYAVVGTAVNLLLTLPAAFGLSRKGLVGRNPIMFVITFTMFFHGGLIPTYLVVKNLGLLNSIWAMIIPQAVGVWNLIVARTFFQSTIPEELHDSAVIDGCSDNRFFLSIVLPVSTALVAIMVLFYGVQHWNTYFQALIYLRDEELYPLQLVLRAILIENEISDEMAEDVLAMQQQQRIAELIKYGIIILASLPLLILYPFLQRYFVKGVMIGAIKG